jgi:hypothetical protein
MVLREDAERSFCWEAESCQISLDEDAVDAVFSLAQELRVVDFVLREGMKADYQMQDRKCVFEFKEVCAPFVDDEPDPTLNYLVDSLGRKLYDISDKLLICGTHPPLFDYLMDNMGRKLYDISGKLLLEKE